MHSYSPKYIAFPKSLQLPKLRGFNSEILKVILEVLEEQPQGIEQYKAGKTNIVDFLVGQVMKKTRGQANPAMTRSMMIEEIEKR